MGIKRRHKLGRIREADFSDQHSDTFTRYQQAINAIDATTREVEEYSKHGYAGAE